MKKIIFSIVFFAFNVSIAESILAPDYICQGENGLQYNFFTSSFFSEIQIFDKDGNSKGRFNGIDFGLNPLKTAPPQVSVAAVSEDGQVVAFLTYVEGDKVATGSVVDTINGNGPVAITCEL